MFYPSTTLVHVIFIFEMYSCVIRIAIDVNRAVLLDVKVPALGFKLANVLLVMLKHLPIKIQK